MSRNRRPKRIPLRERLAWRPVLYEAFAKVTSGANPDSAGPDGVTIDCFRKSAKAELAKLRDEIKHGEYSPSLGRGVAIPKKPGVITPATARPITVFNVRDRIVQRAILNLIWPHVRDSVFSEVSFGGIRTYAIRGGQIKSCLDTRKNVRAAAKKILELKLDGYGFTFETDIQRFFPSIDKDILRNELRRHLPEDSLDDLIERSIATNVSNFDDLEFRGLSECWDPMHGVPQGGVLSPLLANLYLAPFDRAMTSAGFNLVRYVDDLVVLTKSQEEAIDAFNLSKTLLSDVGLTIHGLNDVNEKGKIKTRIVALNQPFDFLGLTFNKQSVQPSQSKVADLRDRVKEITHARTGRKTLVDIVVSLNRMLRGWMSSYEFCDIPVRLLTQIDHVARTGLASWMTYHKIVHSQNALTPELQRKIGLWTVNEAEIRPVSKIVFGTNSRHKTTQAIVDRVEA